MSLQLIQSANPAFSYLGYPSSPPSFVYTLPVPNTNYQESLVRIQGFYYDANRDVYVVIGQFDQIYWPSWKYTRLDFSPVTGSLVSRQDFSGGALGFAWTRGYTSSDFKKVYAQRIAAPTNAIIEITATLPDPTTSQLNNPIVESSDVANKNLFAYALNRANKIVAFNTGSEPYLERYNYGTGDNLGKMKLPSSNIFNIASESEELLWILMLDESGIGYAIAKINFINRKYELYSKLINATAGVDQEASIAFDSLRKSIAIFRRRSDNPSTGAATHVLDIYKPIIDLTTLTSPVPVDELKPNSRVRLVAHLSDDKGAAGGKKTVKVTNLNSNGTLKQPVTTVKTNGSILIPYDTPGPNETDTISLQVTI